DARGGTVSRSRRVRGPLSVNSPDHRFTGRAGAAESGAPGEGTAVAGGAAGAAAEGVAGSRDGDAAPCGSSPSSPLVATRSLSPTCATTTTPPASPANHHGRASPPPSPADSLCQSVPGLPYNALAR